MIHSQELLVADIGGTNARFALAHGETRELTAEVTFATKNYTTIFDALSAYTAQLSCAVPKWVCIAIAGPIHDDVIHLTNNHWSFAVEALRTSLQADQLLLVNDLKAMAAGLLTLDEDDCDVLHDAEIQPLQPVTVIGVGTGLGVASIVWHGGQPIFLEGEGGHIHFAPTNRLEEQILTVLRQEFSRVSLERLLSGSGLENLYWAISMVREHPVQSVTAAEITALAHSGDCVIATETLSVFSGLLGNFAGDLALVNRTMGGVYLGGGVMQHVHKLFNREKFMQHFLAKGRLSGLMQKIPVRQITSAQVSLRGAAFLLCEEM